MISHPRKYRLYIFPVESADSQGEDKKRRVRRAQNVCQVAKHCVFPGLWLWRVDLGSVKRRGVERFDDMMDQNLHHAVARERLGSQNRQKTVMTGAFLEVQVLKICLRLSQSASSSVGEPFR